MKVSVTAHFTDGSKHFYTDAEWALVRGAVFLNDNIAFIEKHPERELPVSPIPFSVKALRKELRHAPMKSMFTLTRDELIEVFGGWMAVMSDVPGEK